MSGVVCAKERVGLILAEEENQNMQEVIFMVDLKNQKIYVEKRRRRTNFQAELNE